MKDNKNLKICEIFDSISGEGLRAGKVCAFIRFSGCNLDCAFCDTKYHEEVSYILDIKDIEHEYKTRNKIVGRKYVIFTGGEPYLQNHEQLKRLADFLFENGTEHIEIETNGKHLDDFIEIFDMYHKQNKVSFTSDFKTEYMNDTNYLLGVICGYKNLTFNDCIKVVVKTLDEIEMAKNLSDKFPNTTVIVSPCFGVLYPSEICSYIISKNYQNLRIQIQIHKYIWEVNTRGK